MEFLYTARDIYDKEYDNSGMSWNGYVEWAKLPHLTELLSLDCMLNECLVNPDRNDEEDWKQIHVVDFYETGFFKTLDYVFKRMKKQARFNLLVVVVEPKVDCRNIAIDGYEFIGYELLDSYFDNSALTNCGGFPETFTASDLNDKGLINEYTQACDIKRRLFENNPEEHHADTILIAVWRHTTIGQIKPGS